MFVKRNKGGDQGWLVIRFPWVLKRQTLCDTLEAADGDQDEGSFLAGSPRVSSSTSLMMSPPLEKRTALAGAAS